MLSCVGCGLQALQKVQGPTRQDQEAAKKHLAAAAVELEAVRATAHPDPGSSPGFSPDVNRRLMAPVPPRSIAVSPRCCPCKKGLVNETVTRVPRHLYRKPARAQQR